MPIVPIEENQEAIAGVTDKRFKPADYSDSGLEVLGKGLAALGDGGAQLADALDEKKRLAAEIAAAKLGDTHQRNIDDATAKGAYSNYSDASAATLFGEDGLFHQKGIAAHAVFPATVAGLTDSYDQAMASLDPVLRDKIAPILSERLNSDVDQAAHYVRQQGVAGQQAGSLKLQQAAARDTALNAGNPDLFAHHMATGENAIYQQQRLYNLPDADVQRQIDDYRSGTTAGAITALMERDPVHAAGWYAQFGGNLNPADRNRVQATLDLAPANGQGAAPLEAGSAADESDIPAGLRGDVDMRQSASGDAAAPDADASPPQPSNGATTDPGDENDNSDPYANLRSLVDGHPADGTLKDANFSPDQTGGVADNRQPVPGERAEVGPDIIVRARARHPQPPSQARPTKPSVKKKKPAPFSDYSHFVEYWNARRKAGLALPAMIPATSWKQYAPDPNALTRASVDGNYNRITLHHTGNYTDPRDVENLDRDHEPALHYLGRLVKNLGSPESYDQYGDITYHFLIGKDGTIYEGRSLLYQGAHTWSQNPRNIGVAFMGDYSKQPLTPEQVHSAKYLIRELNGAYGIYRNAGGKPYIFTHRDLAPATGMHSRPLELAGAQTQVAAIKKWSLGTTQPVRKKIM